MSMTKYVKDLPILADCILRIIGGIVEVFKSKSKGNDQLDNLEHELHTLNSSLKSLSGLKFDKAFSDVQSLNNEILGTIQLQGLRGENNRTENLMINQNISEKLMQMVSLLEKVLKNQEKSKKNDAEKKDEGATALPLTPQNAFGHPHMYGWQGPPGHYPSSYWQFGPPPSNYPYHQQNFFDNDQLSCKSFKSCGSFYSSKSSNCSNCKKKGQESKQSRRSNRGSDEVQEEPSAEKQVNREGRRKPDKNIDSDQLSHCSSISGKTHESSKKYRCKKSTCRKCNGEWKRSQRRSRDYEYAAYRDYQMRVYLNGGFGGANFGRGPYEMGPPSYRPMPNDQLQFERFEFNDIEKEGEGIVPGLESLNIAEKENDKTK